MYILEVDICGFELNVSTIINRLGPSLSMNCNIGYPFTFPLEQYYFEGYFP